MGHTPDLSSSGQSKEHHTKKETAKRNAADKPSVKRSMSPMKRKMEIQGLAMNELESRQIEGEAS